ncbi:MAG TPA: ABC transporter permease [Terriglobales bacterium]
MSGWGNNARGDPVYQAQRDALAPSRRGGFMDRFNCFVQDVRYALRGFRRDRVFTLLAIVALALGIGAVTVIFSVIENVLIEPFPYRAPDRLAIVYVHDTTRPQDYRNPSYRLPEFLDIQAQNHVFEDTMGNSGLDILYTDREGTLQFEGEWVTPNTFEFLGMQPMLGRMITRADGDTGAVPVFAMSHRLWKKQFNSDPNLVGKTLILNGQPRTLVAVMPPRFLLGNADIWVPSNMNRSDPETQKLEFWMLARTKPGVTLQQATSDLDVIIRNLAKTYPNDFPKNFTVGSQTLTDDVVGQFRATLYTLLAAVGMLLLIACSNVANLLLARATAREREIAIRASMGASRERIVRQLLVESLMLAGGGCLLGCLFAYLGLKGVTAAMPDQTIPAEAVLQLNVRALLFAIAVTGLTTLLCGLAPALHAVRGELQNRLKDTGKGVNTEFRHSKFRSGLVVWEVMLSIVLLVGAGLMMRSLFALQHVELGLNPVNILVARTPLPKGQYETAEQKKIFFRQVLQRVNALPSVIAATETSSLPPYGGPESDLTIPGKTHSEPWHVMFQLCSDGYFKTMGRHLLRGRLLTESDVDGARPVAVVNDSFVKTYFKNEDPIGQKIKFNLFDELPQSTKDQYFEVIGVVADAKNRGLQQGIEPEAYIPYTVTGAMERGVLVRTGVEPMSMLMLVRREIWAVDKNVALTLTGTLEGYLQQFSYAGPRFGLILLGVFATVGLVLVAIGVFSVMAYSVSLQTHEIGIRMALGAPTSNVLRMVLRKGLRLISVGILLGMLASIGLTRFVSSQFWGVSPRDPVTFLGVIVVLAVVGTAACLVPARRATRVDPLIALRYE